MSGWVSVWVSERAWVCVCFVEELGGDWTVEVGLCDWRGVKEKTPVSSCRLALSKCFGPIRSYKDNKSRKQEVEEVLCEWMKVIRLFGPICSACLKNDPIKYDSASLFTYSKKLKEIIEVIKRLRALLSSRVWILESSSWTEYTNESEKWKYNKRWTASSFQSNG